MGAAKPCLGYPSRTAAVVALRGQGLSTNAIARKIGIEPKTVSALEGSLWRGNLRPIKPVSSANPNWQNFIRIDPETLAALRAPAARRGLSVQSLVEQLLIVMTDDGLVDALMDDDCPGPRA